MILREMKEERIMEESEQFIWNLLFAMHLIAPIPNRQLRIKPLY